MASSETERAPEGSAVSQADAQRPAPAVDPAVAGQAGPAERLAPGDRPKVALRVPGNAPRRRRIPVRLVDMAIASVACLFLVVQFLPGVRSGG